MRTITAGLGSAALLTAMAFGAAQADVPMSGKFTATQACPAYQSFRKSTNPGEVKIEQSKTYELLAKNKPDASHYRIVIQGAQPAERWVGISCGRVDGAERGEREEDNSAAPNRNATVRGGAQGIRATHVLAMGWEPAFCAEHSGKSECRVLTSTSFAGTHLSLHGLWPQPRGTQYCNVEPDLRQADHDHDWNDLPEPDMRADTLKRLSAVMPGVQSNLQRHEWIVHGTCFGGNADGYFARAAGLAEALDASKVAKLFADNAGRNLSAEAIRAAFDDAFGSGAGARVTVSCNGRGESRMITELVIGLAGDVTGSARLGDLIHAAQAVPPGCPGGVVERAPF